MPQKKQSDSKFRNNITQRYLNEITEICVKVLKMSTLDREEKLLFRGKIKKLVWNSEEDLDEDCYTSWEHYLDNLIKMLQTYKERSVG